MFLIFLGLFRFIELKKKKKKEILLFLYGDFTWKAHVNYLINKVSKSIGILRRTRRSISMHTASIIYKSFILCLESCYFTSSLMCFQSYRLTLYHTHVFTSLWPPMLLLSLLRKLTMSSWVLLRSPMPALSQPIRWWNVTHVTANTWLAVCCSAVMWYQRMWMQLLRQSRPREPFSLWTGARPVLRLVLCWSHVKSYYV